MKERHYTCYKKTNTTKHIMDRPISIQICCCFNTILHYISPTVHFDTLLDFGIRYGNISRTACDI